MGYGLTHMLPAQAPDHPALTNWNSARPLPLEILEMGVQGFPLGPGLLPHSLPCETGT